jgi:outer membrane protein assembly factor BamB
MSGRRSDRSATTRRRGRRTRSLGLRMLEAVLVLALVTAIAGGATWAIGAVRAGLANRSAADTAKTATGTALPSSGATEALAPAVTPATSAVPGLPVNDGDGIKVGTYLGNESRTFYGIGPVPETLRVIWRNRIGTGQTMGTKTVKGVANWSGTGWTGQATIIREAGMLNLVVGGFDHGLRRIDAATGTTIWRYEFPDVIKGTNTIWIDPEATSEDTRIRVIAGSRRGFGLTLASPGIAPVRCVSFATGRELWRLPVRRTQSYSRDADASAIVRDGVVYQGVESADFYKLDPDRTKPLTIGGATFRRPVVLASALLYENGDAAAHGGNLVFEASPCMIGDVIYAAAGSGRVYGLRASDLKEVWQYRTGSDLDGTPAATRDGYLLVSLDREYIKGRGGVIKLDPRKTGAAAAVWYLPTENRPFAEWTGGIIGSVSVNDSYDADGSRPALAACIAIDGNLYLFSQNETKGTTVIYDGKTRLPKPVVVFKRNVGAAISTPIIVGDNIIACGYDSRVKVYRIVYDDPEGVPLKARNGKTVRVGVKLMDSLKLGGTIESTPVVWNGRIYVGCRDGYFYCIGSK